MYNLRAFWKVCFSFAILIHFKKVSTLPQCETSLHTLKYVDNCPTNAVSWKEAAERMDCQSIAKNCSKSSDINVQKFVFQYHCVLNSWMNATLEVCAFNRTILGFCTEFNTRGSLIQDNYASKCTSFDPPCPTSYNSAEAYKYPTCYALARRNYHTAGNYTASSSARLIGNISIMFGTIIFGKVL